MKCKIFLFFCTFFLFICLQAISQHKDTIPEKLQIEKIREFVKQLRKESPRMMYDYFVFFGENNEREIAFLRNKCETDSLLFEKCIELGKEVYCNPFKYKSLVFQAIEEGELGKGIKKLHPEDNPDIVKDTASLFPSAYLVMVKNNTFIFKMTNFAEEGNYIVDIINPEGISILLVKD